MAANADVGKSFIDGVIGKLPVEQQAQARAIFEDAQAAAALEEAGRGYKSLSETSRLADEARQEKERAQAVYNQNKAWYDANATELQNAANYRQRLAELEAAGGRPDPTPAPTPAPSPTPAPTGPKFVSEDEFNRTSAQALGLFGIIIPKLMRKHDKLFGEELDTESLITEAQAKGLSLDAAYNAKYATQLKQKADEAEAARVKQIQDEAIARFQREHPQMPYAVPGSAGEGSPLDGLKAGAPVDPGINRNLVDESVAMYNELAAKATAGV